MKTITKHPNDVRPFTVNFSLALPVDTLISSATVTATDTSDNDLTNTLIDSVVTTSNKITAFLKGGSNGLRAKVLYTATLDDDKTVLAITVDLVVQE